MRRFDDRLHPRDREGKWARKTGMLSPGASAPPDVVPEVQRPREDFRPATREDRTRLAIPPAWRDVQVAADPKARLLATGRDAKGRRQRLYSAEHHEAQAAAKFARIRALSRALPRLDKRLRADVRAGDQTAMAALLVRRLGMRPGSERDRGGSAKAFGATNLRASHVEISGKTVRLRFTGKSGVEIPLEVEDAEVARMLRGRLAAMGWPGPKAPALERVKWRTENADVPLFPETNETALRRYVDANAPGFKPKDFRTHLATAEALGMVAQMEPPQSKRELQRKRKEVGTHVAGLLGNTPAMALGSYIDPMAFASWDTLTS